MPRKTTSEARDATRDDVARLAGVSTAVVSYVVNDGPRPVAAETRAKVLEAIDKLGYRPNVAARSLITGRSDLIGLVVPDVANPYFGALARAVEDSASARGLRVVLVQSNDEDLPDLVNSLAGHQVDGIITATLPPPDLFARTSRIKVPMVKLSLALPNDSIPALWPDFYGGSMVAVSHLVEVHGHRRVALVTGGEQLDARGKAWRDALEGFGLRADSVVHADWSSEGGRAAAGELLERFPDVTAVFVTSDQQAIGLLSGLHIAGRRVPDDLSLASFDGSLGAEFTVPSLTTVGVPFSDMARDAIDELLGAPADDRMYPTSLIVRESCGCSPAGQSTATAL
ncbi:MAG TPA: LacI family DNA-binding transcriptional regulator [Propionibacteriaceae bacterium]|nr:LacI family DNA-binding transcriptional regulator [Propionibacteriaceae bacterium]